MKRLLILLSLLLLTPLAHAWQGSLSAAEWARPRSGAALVRMPVLQQAVTALRAQPESHLQLRYPGGDTGSMWAQELKAWLVALGVVSERIELLPGGTDAGSIELSTRDAR